MKQKILAFIYSGKKFLALYSEPHPKHGKGGWFVVTGTVEKKESLEEAVKREVIEETGLDVKEIFDLNWDSVYEWENEICKEHNFLSFAEQEEIILNEEHSNFEWLNLDEFVEKINWDDDKNLLRNVLEKAVKKELYFVSR
jgi:8-oxo-dGTP pyrophosphatase MutT (NUDIX family)